MKEPEERLVVFLPAFLPTLLGDICEDDAKSVNEQVEEAEEQRQLGVLSHHSLSATTEVMPGMLKVSLVLHQGQPSSPCRKVALVLHQSQSPPPPVFHPAVLVVLPSRVLFITLRNSARPGSYSRRELHKILAHWRRKGCGTCCRADAMNT
jgi:hypothetical protein